MAVRLAVMAVATTLLAPAVVCGQSVALSFTGGRVTLVADGASLGEILARWAELADVTIVNLDRLPAAPLAIQLTDVTERAALETLLRPVSGYVLGRRAAGPGSEIDRIVILPVSAALDRPVPAGASRPFAVRPSDAPAGPEDRAVAVPPGPSTASSGFLVLGAPPASGPEASSAAASVVEGAPAGTPDVSRRPPAGRAAAPAVLVKDPQFVVPPPTVDRSQPEAEPASPPPPPARAPGPFGAATSSPYPGTISPVPAVPASDGTTQ